MARHKEVCRHYDSERYADGSCVDCSKARAAKDYEKNKQRKLEYQRARYQALKQAKQGNK